MESKEVRRIFLEYFKQKGHDVVRSSGLIPANDPTLLFTNAGMVQFKGVFLGEETRPYTRATTCQKSMRAGGKHSDLDNVGHTKRHHTLFEMLGNFSFGDYFKRDAISFAWELLTKHYKLPADKLWATVYEDDDEAAALWRDVVGLPAERIVRMGAKDNFWQMADTGPCGPCSEIIIDQGPDAGCGSPECKLGCDCDRYLELWNLVFMQFNRDDKGVLHPLPKPSIDTGMGLERICAVMQGKFTNFDTDLFAPIKQSISDLTGVPYGKSSDTDASIRVIADHVRAATFLISDGLMPANDGRGYVLRRVIRRAARHARLLGAQGLLLSKVVDSVVDKMGDVYPELISERARAIKVLEIEEERFHRTLEQGMRILDSVLDNMRKASQTLIPGDEIFKLYDTFGFPVDLVRDIAHDSGLQVDEEGFRIAMEAQRERARASWVGQDEAVAAIYREVLIEAGGTEFTGYDALSGEAVVKAIVREGRVVEEVAEGQRAEIFLDRTPFYGDSGGQVGDHGAMTTERAAIDVIDTKKPVGSLISHHVVVTKGTLKVWDRVQCAVNTERRLAIMRNHTATHLLQSALRGVLGDHVKQAGSLVEPERLRFDFTHFTGLTPDEASAVEAAVNEAVLQNIALNVQQLAIEDAVASGAMALFGEKYGDTVRVVSVPGVSRELCGGTHCQSTGQIGLFIVDSEGSVASGIRRIEALTGEAALKKMKQQERELKEIAALLKTSLAPSERVRQVLDEMRALERENEKLKSASMKDESAALVARARDIKGVKVLSARIDDLDPKDLRAMADHVRDRMGSGIVVLASAKDGQAALLATVTKDLTKAHSAGNILKAVAEACNGRGGGKPDMAQGGTKDLALLDKALEKVYDEVESKA